MKNKKKFLILGGSSNLATCFQFMYPQEVIVLPKDVCDITVKSVLERVIKKTPCSYVINTAAITDVQECEKNPTQCLIVNTVAPLLIYEACQKYRKKFIHISSDYAAFPVNVYGLSKYISEKVLGENALIIRTNFYSKQTYIIKKLLGNLTVNAYTNLFFNPISINRLCEELYIQRKRIGLANFFTNDKISYYQFASKVCTVFGISKTKFLKKSIFHNEKNYKRPLNSYCKSSINVHIDEDLIQFKTFFKNL